MTAGWHDRSLETLCKEDKRKHKPYARVFSTSSAHPQVTLEVEIWRVHVPLRILRLLDINGLLPVLESSPSLLCGLYPLSAMLVLDYDHLVAISLAIATSRDRARESFLVDGDGGPYWEGMAKACVEAMGPNGDGFVAVRGMKNYGKLRCGLLPLAQKLALMPNVERAAVLKAHGLGTDVPLKDPNRPVSSFAAQLRFESQPGHQVPTPSDGMRELKSEWNSSEDNFSDLENLFNQLGMCMVEVGLLVARLCDATQFHGGLRKTSLEQAIIDSSTAKGRLIHYHSLQEQGILASLQTDLKAQKQKKSGVRKGRKAEVSPPEKELAADSGDAPFWQQWHCDYGIFTVLTSPLFMKTTPAVFSELDVATRGRYLCMDDKKRSGSCREANYGDSDEKSNGLVPQSFDSLSIHGNDGENTGESGPRAVSSILRSGLQECAPPEGHSSLQIMDSHGLTTSVVVPSEYLIVQVGEAAQLLSGGELVARAHCVMRPTVGKDVSRETMAVFLQPAWDRRLSLPVEVDERGALGAGVATNLTIHIPLLASRWKDGCTFAEFSKETTRQYYGADGRQSQK